MIIERVFVFLTVVLAIYLCDAATYFADAPGNNNVGGNNGNTQLAGWLWPRIRPRVRPRISPRISSGLSKGLSSRIAPNIGEAASRGMSKGMSSRIKPGIGEPHSPMMKKMSNMETNVGEVNKRSRSKASGVKPEPEPFEFPEDRRRIVPEEAPNFAGGRGGGGGRSGGRYAF